VVIFIFSLLRRKLIAFLDSLHCLKSICYVLFTSKATGPDLFFKGEEGWTRTSEIFAPILAIERSGLCTGGYKADQSQNTLMEIHPFYKMNLKKSFH